MVVWRHVHILLSKFTKNKYTGYNSEYILSKYFINLHRHHSNIYVILTVFQKSEEEYTPICAARIEIIGLDGEPLI